MPYVQRDEAGTIVGQFANQQPGIAEEWIEEGAPDLDAGSALEAATHARQWRNSEIAKTDYLAMPDYPLTDSKRAELLEYRRVLRDWPKSQGFPATSRPDIPAWIAVRLGSSPA